MRRTLWEPMVLTLGFLALHALALIAGGEMAMTLSFAFLIAAPALAGMACLHRERHDRGEGWLALGLSMLCWAAGMAATMAGLYSLGVTSEVSLSMLLYVLYGVPLIFALASPRGEAWPVRLIDGALSLALGYIFLVHIVHLTTLYGTTEANAATLRIMFDVENGYIALFAVIRLAACRTTQRGLFHVIAAYAACYMLVAGYTNHFQNETDFGQWPDLLIPLPFLLLLGMTLATARKPAGDAVAGPASLFVRAVQAGSPLMIPGTLLTVSALLLPHDPALAVGGCIAGMLGYGLRSILVQVRSLNEQERLQALSHIDALTGVPNRRQFDDGLKREWARARRENRAIALLMIDIDHFKQLNDHYGHAVGDERLRAVAQALKGTARRETDLVARYGGEEFAAILPGMGLREAARLAEEMRRAVAALALPSPVGSGIVTVSIGLAHAERVTGEMQTLLESADAALYEAKRAGRNRVVEARLVAGEVRAIGAGKRVRVSAVR